MTKKFEIDDYGRRIWTESGLKQRLLAGENIQGLTVEETPNTRQYLETQAKRSPLTKKQFTIVDNIDITPEEFHKLKLNEYLIPDSYMKLDIEDYLLNKVVTDSERARLLYELELYKERDMYNVLRIMVYIVDTLRRHNVLWGVGRGSSVSSYVLYLIGINRINPLQYGLDISEFLR